MNEIERERWRGLIDGKVSSLERDVSTLFRLNKESEVSCHRLELLINTLTGNVATLAMKIGVMATMGAFLGGAGLQYALTFLKH